MFSGALVLTFDWVVEHFVALNEAKMKNKRMMRILRYIFRLAAQRGCKIDDCFFQLLCHSSVSVKKIQKATKKLATFVSSEEMKVLMSVR